MMGAEMENYNRIEEMLHEKDDTIAELLEALELIWYNTIVKSSKTQMENQIDFVRRTADEAIRKQRRK